MPKKLKNTKRLKAYKKEGEDDHDDTGQELVNQRTIRSGDDGSEGGKFLPSW